MTSMYIACGLFVVSAFFVGCLRGFRLGRRNALIQFLNSDATCKNAMRTKLRAEGYEVF